MSLWTNLLETYENVQDIADIVPSGKNGVRQALLPLCHMTLPTRICVTLDQYGKLIRIEEDHKDIQIIIPCTEESMGRSGKNPPPHPVCDKLQYIDSSLEPEKHGAYLRQLANWKGDNIKLNAIYQYLSNHSVVADACQFDLDLSGEKKKAEGVRFAVRVPHDDTPHVEDDRTIQRLWIDYQQDRGEESHGKDLLGDEFRKAAANFPKNIVSAAGNAKLISANDATNFTFRGRFANRDEAMCIDSMTSQKVHSVLRWLVNTNGTGIDTQSIVIWAVSDPEESFPDPCADSWGLGLSDSIREEVDKEERPDIDKLEAGWSSVNTVYAERFGKLLQGYGKAENLKKQNQKMVVLVLDAATTGRLGVTFYRELNKQEYIENVLQWHIDSAWPLTRFLRTRNDDDEDGNAVKNKEQPVKIIRYVGAPSFKDIIDCVWDTDEHSSNGYRKFSKYVRAQLIRCIFDNDPLPRALLQQAYHRVTRPTSYDKESTWRRNFEIACSLWKKSFTDDVKKYHDKKGVTVELDTTRTDRDYLYGRLLALADNFEYRVLKKAQLAGKRPTNAIKLMGNFVSKPYATWGNLWKQLLPYLKAENGAVYFQDDIDEVMSLFQNNDFEDNSSLSPLFLMGYSCERRHLINSAINKQTDKNSENEGE